MSLIRWSEQTAIFGGTFDPPHLGHREAVRGLFANPGVKRVIIVPSASPPHKAALSSVEHRLAMTKINFSSTINDPFPSNVEIDLLEIERAKETGRPSYSFDTFEYMKKKLGKLAVVIGADQLADLESWYKFPELLKLANWLVLERLPHGSKAARQTLQSWKSGGLLAKDVYIDLVSTPAPDISSTRIRESIGRCGQAPANTLLPEVWAYLKENALYGTQKNGS